MQHTVTQLLRAGRCCLVVIDPQEKLMKVIQGAENITNRMVMLINCFQALNMPVIATTQYVKGLGPFVPEIAGLIHDGSIIDKMEFNAFSNQNFISSLKSLSREIDSLVICGVEAHICIYQTAAGAVNAGYRTWVVSDAVSSRHKKNKRDAVRVISSFAPVGPAEMVIYQLLEKAGTEHFKTILPYVK